MEAWYTDTANVVDVGASHIGARTKWTGRAPSMKFQYNRACKAAKAAVAEARVELMQMEQALDTATQGPGANDEETLASIRESLQHAEDSLRRARLRVPGVC
jgi:multidrug resistance efflux pump